MRAAAGNAGIAVAYEAPVKAAGDTIEDDVMHHAIPKIGRPDFPDFRVGHDKGDTAADLVIPTRKVTVKPDEVALQVRLETQVINGIALRPAAIKIGIEYSLKRQAGLGGHQSKLQLFCGRVSGKGVQLRTTA